MTIIKQTYLVLSIFFVCGMVIVPPVHAEEIKVSSKNLDQFSGIDKSVGNIAIVSGDIFTSSYLAGGPIIQMTSPMVPFTPTNGTVPKQSSPVFGGGTPDLLSHISARLLATTMATSLTTTNFQVLALFGNIMILLLGAYVRLRSGRSPSFVQTP